MKKLLERELFAVAIEQISGVTLDRGDVISEVAVVSAVKISKDDELRLSVVVKRRFPQANLVLANDPSLGGGLIVRVGQHTFDHSFWTRIKQLVGFQGQ
ncbi:MAG: F0F1 ATP synthase subunit delta [Candidatus Omnitrophica bacterium]|nr:F0F1 ATP synthase subunit delta [Candidatus Omnitrophota bacterium]